MRQVAVDGAARLYGIPAESRVLQQDLVVTIPRPPYGQDGQWVRIVAVEDPQDPSELEMLGAAGQATWFGHGGAWYVTVAGSGTGIHPGEHLDFAPDVTAEEVAALSSYLDKS